MSEWQPIETMPEDKADDVDARFLQAAQAVPVVGEPDCYDAGLLGDFGGGNVAWWQDYIRAELARAHDFYVGQSAPEVVPIVSKTVGYLAGGTLMRRKIQGYNCKPLIVQPTTSITAAELERLRKDAERPDCGTCANRGRVNGLSQETFCEHCLWSERWRKNHYKPTATQERQP